MSFVNKLLKFSWLMVLSALCLSQVYAGPDATITVTVSMASTNNGPVNMGSTVNFTILASSSITSGGGTINGDIGLSPAAGSSITGMTAIQVNGTIYAVDNTGPSGSVSNPALLTAAQNDLTAAYNDAAGRTSADVVDPGFGEIGGMNLVPGLYKFTSTASIMAGDLTLTGSSNDVWIFQIGSSLTVGSGIHVMLAGGAQARNIFWQVGSSATLGSSSVFKGTIMAQESITMDTGSTIEGRALALTGTVIFNGSSGSLPQEDFSPLSIQINAPSAGATYTSMTNLLNVGGTASDSAGVTQVAIRNSRDVAGFTCTGTDNWQFNGLQLFQGENYLDAIAFNALGNSVTGTLQVTYNGDTQYGDVLLSGNIVQEIVFPDVLTPGTNVTVQWKILSYVPIRCRVYARDPARTWTNFINGVYVGSQESLFNLNGRHAGIYSFQCTWPVPQKSGEIDVWFNVAQMDGDQYMMPMIPDGVDSRPHPTVSKVIQRTILAGGDGSAPQSDPDIWDNLRIFETVDQHKMRSACTITSITCPDNVSSGAQMTVEWKVLSYMPVESQVLLVNISPAQIYVTTIGTLVGTAATTYTFVDRVSGQSYSAMEYTYRATFTATAPSGSRGICFRNKKQTDPASFWMFGNISIRADSANRPAIYNGICGRFIERTIDP